MGDSDGRVIPDAFNPCGNELFVAGELIDWDSTASAFLGVFGAEVSLQGDPAVSISTPPNGRLELCAPKVDPLEFDVDAPPDYLDGTLYIEGEALDAFRQLSFRTITSARASTFYAERGLTFDPARGHVVVFLAGDRAGLTLDRPHGTTQAGNEDNNGDITWTAGDGGRYVLFPNVDVTQPTATITGDTSGPHTVPVAAGALTLAGVFFVFL